MDYLIKNEIVEELNFNETKKIDGGDWISESIAWLYGFAEGRHRKAAKNGAYDDTDWDKMRVLVGG